ncbi:hypothetical protein [Edwardsiella phage GF-2]|uniref:Uncharacterized protein n=1 Tax=Edwardsiella phage GF-2 TaxID=1537091 RepID=A0A077KC35_9CAUD|nr:hypothetical protein VC56_gp46 [Edwardsiella phage GF-2]BAP28917.1 hypothetical protein [Edwardsiella phage GF-2]
MTLEDRKKAAVASAMAIVAILRSGSPNPQLEGYASKRDRDIAFLRARDTSFYPEPKKEAVIINSDDYIDSRSTERIRGQFGAVRND